MTWTATDIPDQSGRTAIVTGGNGGLGLETARELARKGAHVIIAARNLDKAATLCWPSTIRAGLLPSGARSGICRSPGVPHSADTTPA